MTVDPGFVKELVELLDGDCWQLADRLAERYPADEYGEGSSANSGLYAELGEYATALREEHGIKLSVATMRQFRATAIAWPRDTRVSRAPYSAHKLLRTATGRDRLIVTLVKRNGGRLTVNDVQRWRADQSPKPIESWDAKVERLLRHAVRRADARTAEAREVVVEKLHLLARELSA